MKAFSYEIRMSVRHEKHRLIPSGISGDVLFNDGIPFQNEGELLHSNLHAYIAGLAGTLKLIKRQKQVDFDLVLGHVLREIVEKVGMTDEELGFSGGISEDDLKHINL